MGRGSSGFPAAGAKPELGDDWFCSRLHGYDQRACPTRRPRVPPRARLILPPVEAPMLDAVSRTRVFEIEPAVKSQKAFVDFQHDVTADDIRLAYREGFHSVEHLKRYTTLGMATDQGKTSNVPGLAIMADVRGISIPEAGTTRFRPPFTPVSLGVLGWRTIRRFASASTDAHA